MEDKTTIQDADDVYSLIVDENRSDLFNFMVGFLVQGVGDPFVQQLEEEGMVEEFDNFLDEFNRKHHKQGWCKDPDCLQEE